MDGCVLHFIWFVDSQTAHIVKECRTKYIIGKVVDSYTKIVATFRNRIVFVASKHRMAY